MEHNFVFPKVIDHNKLYNIHSPKSEETLAFSKRSRKLNAKSNVAQLSDKQRTTIEKACQTIGDRIRQACDEKGITDRELAQALDVTEKSVMNWKNNGQPSLKYLNGLIAVLECDAKWLLDGTVSDDLLRDETQITNVEFISANRAIRLIPRLAITDIVDTINNNPDNYKRILAEWVNRNESFDDPIAITFNPKYPLGVPTFAQMCNVDWFPEIPFGATIGWSTEILPAPTAFCLFALKDAEEIWRHATGFWFPSSDMRYIPMAGKASYKRTKSFWLVADKQGRKSHESRHDIYIEDATQAKFIATKTWLQYTDSLTMTEALMGTADNARIQFESRKAES